LLTLLQKLETLLQLPPSLELVKARVLLLRITVPVDVYSSPIQVEVEGIESQLRLKSKSEKPARTNHDRKRRGPQSKPPNNAYPHTKLHKGKRSSDFAEDSDSDSAIPTAADLAQSFLQTEPEEERAELEAAILSETQEIGTSSVLSDDGELPVGTGATLSLPSFMTNFLQGIVDRMQLRIRGVTFSLDVDIPNENSRSPPSSPSDPVTIQLKIDDIDVEGVTHGLGENLKTDNDPSPRFKEGKRLICLSKIRGYLISEANFFSSLARSSALSSPSAAHSDVFEERRSASKSNSSTRGSVLRSVDRGPSPEQRSNVSSRLSMRSLPRRAADPNALNSSIVTSNSGRFDDASEDGDASNISESGHLSDVGDSVFRNSAYLDQVGESQYSMDNDDEGRGSAFLPSVPRGLNNDLASTLSTPRASTHLPDRGEPPFMDPRPVEEDPFPSMLQSTILPTRPHTRFSADRVSQSQPFLPSGTPRLSRGNSSLQHHENAQEGDEEEDNSTPIGEEDLAQSQLFSHEDAESMYMSALSHDSSSSRIPGGWTHSSSEGERSTPGSPTSPQVHTAGPLDNLENARHLSSAQGPTETEHFPESISAFETLTSSRRLSTSAAVAPSESQHVPSVPQSSSGVSERSTASSDEYTRLNKQVFILDRIDIYLPPVATESAPDPHDLSTTGSMFSSAFDGHSDTSRSASINIPGAFSTHLPAQRTSSIPHRVPLSSQSTESKTESEDSKSTIELAIGHLLMHFDISIGRLVFKLVHQLKDILSQGSPAATSSKSEPSRNDRTVILNAEEISLKFLERLEGTLGPVGELDTGRWAAPPEADVLLRTTFSGLRIKTLSLRSTTKTSLTLKKFLFGYAHEHIVSFDGGLQMKASVRDLKASAGIDVSVNITHAPEITRCEVVTLPMHISIDLQRLDETFSWFGGLSSVLNLGSSIASNATITASSPGKPKARGVRFETPIRPDDQSMALQNKADVRIGGFILDFVGTECSVGVETSAVKVVSRNEGIGVFVHKIRISGPHLRRSSEDPAINLDISSTSIEYSPSPKDADLDRLLSLITPSKAKYDQDDDILLDTLLRQRKQGAVLRLSVDDIQTRIGRLHELSYLPELGEEVSRLSTVATYLPDDDRPGLLSLIMVKKFNAHVDVNNTLGTIQLSSTDIEIAQITLPALIALSVDTVSARRNSSEDLIGAATDPGLRQPGARAPAIMARMIGDEMEPVVKLKLWNLKVEYRVPTLITLLGLTENATAQDVSASLTASVATLTDYARSKETQGVINQPTQPGRSSTSDSKPLIIDIVLRDCLLGLNPLGQPTKLLVVLTEAHFTAALPKDQNANASLDLSKASLLIIDNVANISSVGLKSRPRRYSFDGGSTQVADLGDMGYVQIGSLSSAKAIVQMTTSEDGERSIDVELRDDLFILESCADSTQTLIAILNGLTPPTPPSKEIKYRTKVIPVQDLLASLSGDAFGTAEGNYDFDDDFAPEELEGDYAGGDDSDELGFNFDHYQKDPDEQGNVTIFEAGSSTSTHLTSRDTRDGVLLDSIMEPHEEPESEALEFQDDHFGTGSILEGTAHRWNSAKNTYDRSNSQKVKKSPLKVCIRDVHIIWNLFDGYDWQHTRDTISKAVQDVESKAIEKRARNERRPTFDQDIEDEETVIGDFLFNSIYIGIPANRDPRELAAAINQELNDNATETESIATTYLSSSPSRQSGARKSKAKKLRLKRSKHHKITFELRGVSVDLVVFPPDSGETQSSVDVRVHNFEIFDHVPTSTWRKFATYMQDAGERETGSSMIHIEILNVKPVPELAASEIVLKATVLPLRLHVDQDALDFITRFFEFKDESAPIHASPGDVPFLQRVEVNSIQVKLDFKPKRVDYAGLRSGHTTEFMNFLILDEADMVLRHTIIYGISGFDKLGKTLNDIWMPDIKRNQLPGILAGLAPVRSLVNVGDGFRHLVLVPIREYKKDGRIVRGISKGAAAFAKTTGTELVKLGAKVAIGVQTVLQGAEGFLGPGGESSKTAIDEDEPEEDTKQISLYANQPVGVLQGLRGGYAGLQRDLMLARDAIIAIPGEVMESGKPGGVVNALRNHAPTVILRPAIGVAKASGQIFLGATNALDPVNRQKAEAVSHVMSILVEIFANCV
jgi:autophagy-related protein 2